MVQERGSNGGAAEERRFRGLGHASGMKLLRVKTNEIVAVYARVSCAVKKRGKIKFLTGEGRKGDELGNGFELVAVMSLVSILEVERRNGEIGGVPQLLYFKS